MGEAMTPTAKKTLRRAALIALLVATAAALVQRCTAEKPVRVALAMVERGLVEASVTNTRAGAVNACRRAHIAPAMGGNVAQLLVKEGDAVSAGQVLLSLWNDDIAAELALAEREVELARAQSKEVCLRADAATRDAKRFVALQEKRLAAEDDVDRAVSTAQAQRAACQASQVSVTVSSARRSVLEANLERTLLRAPFAGRIAELNAEVGEYITPSPPGIATLPAADLIDTRCLYVSAPLDEINAPKVRPDLPARISVDAFPGRTFEGRVRRVAEYVLELEKQARTVEIEAEFSDPSAARGLLPGYSADVEVVLDVRNEVLRVPSESLLENKRVLVFNTADGVLQARDVKVGIANWKYTEIVAGLDEGEKVVVSVTRQGVEPGVRAQPEAARSEPRSTP
jgi:HlyD family secretion protein